MHAPRLMGAALAAALVLSGCTNTPTPTPEPTATRASSAASPAAPTSFVCEPVPAAVVELAAANADSAGFVADGRAAMVRGGTTSHGFPWRIVALGGNPRADHPDASGTVLWWGPGGGAPEVEADGRVRGQFGPISRGWNGEVGVAFSVPGGPEGQAAAAACPLD